MENKSKNLFMVILALVIVILIIALVIIFYAGTTKDDDTNTNSNTNKVVNTNVNKNLNTNANLNANTNTNLNSNKNANLNENANTNLNENSNTNLNENTNTNSNTNLNTNTNTNSSATKINGWQDVTSETYGFNIQIPSNYWWLQYQGEGSQNYVALYGFTDSEEKIDQGSPYNIELSIISKTANREFYDMIKLGNGNGIILAEEGNWLYVLGTHPDEDFATIFNKMKTTFEIIE